MGEHLRQDINPELEDSDPNLIQELMCRSKTHEPFVEKVKTLSDVTKPDSFTDQTIHLDWKTTLLDYLKHVPGRSGVPLSYLARSAGCTPIAGDLLDEFAVNDLHYGETYMTDRSKVHPDIAKFIKGNSTAESIIISHEQVNDGNVDTQELVLRYKGTAIMSERKKGIESLHCGEDQKP